MRESRRPPLWKSPWLWIGLSGGVLALVAGIFVLISLVPFVSYYKPGGYRDRIRSEPTLFFAEMAARKDTNVKVVSRDPKEHTVTLRNQKTGERFVLGQVEKNKLRIQVEEWEIRPDFAGPRALSGLWLGSAAGPLPPWMPVPPGPRPRPLYALEDKGVISSCFVLVPSGPVEEVFTYYREELDRKAFKVLPAEGTLSASSPDLRTSFFASPTVQQGGRPAVLLTWSEMAGNP